jgi:hypothetical protein
MNRGIKKHRMFLLSHRQYVLSVIFSAFSVVALLVAIAVKGLFMDRIFGYQILYQYQLDKIHANKDAETIFIGDSSLGNAINARLYTRLSGNKTLNLSLTGLYGYAGSYNMLKKAKANIPALKNVIVMQTLDMMKRDTSYKGYLMTLGDISDVKELDTDERNRLLSSFFSLVTSPKNLRRIVKSYFGGRGGDKTIKIENDYIAQGEPIKPESFKSFFAPVFNKEKIHFLEKIDRFCRKNNLQLIYVHGPIHEKIGLHSLDYIKRLNSFIEKQLPDMKLINDVVLIKSRHIGDSVNHVSPQYKDFYTRRYFELIGYFRISQTLNYRFYCIHKA